MSVIEFNCQMKIWGVLQNRKDLELNAWTDAFIVWDRGDSATSALFQLDLAHAKTSLNYWDMSVMGAVQKQNTTLILLDCAEVVM